MADEGKEKKGCCEKVGDGFSNFAKFLFNRETGQVMGRSGESWLKIGVFYLIFYGFLAAFFSAMLTVFLKTINDPADGGPKLTQFIENKPGLTYTKLGRTLADIKTMKDAANQTALIDSYNNTVTSMLSKFSGKDVCVDSDTGMPADKDCSFNTTMLGDCGLKAQPKYGIDTKKPCVYVKINKVYNWVPEPTKGIGNFLKLNCGDGKGIKVMPAGFHIGSFPYRGQKDFQLPVVAVQIDLALVEGQIICYLEGPNIEVSKSAVPHRAFGKVEIL